ncbi:MAG: response regulator [Lysobacterales bacterium]
MQSSSNPIAAFAEKAAAVLVETRRLMAADWPNEATQEHQDDLASLSDYAGNLGLDDAQAAILDVYAYVGVFAEGARLPSAAQREELNALIQAAQDRVTKRAPSGRTSAGAVVYLLTPSLGDPVGLEAALRLQNLLLAAFADIQTLSDALQSQLPELLLVEAALVADVAELLDELALTLPDASRLPLIGIDGGKPAARLQAQLGGADLVLAQLDEPAVVARIKELAAPTGSEPFRVLVVDDDPDLCAFCEVMLGRAGMQVQSTSRPEAVLSLVRSFSPDVVLTDLYMPGMDGLTLTAQLRQQVDTMVLPIVFLSAEHSEQARFQAIQAGGDDFLTKPVRPRLLVSALRSRVKRVRALSKQLSRRSGDAQGHMRRGAFLDELRTVGERASGENIALMVILVDQAYELQERLKLSVAHELEQAIALRLARHFAAGDRYCLIQEFGFAVLAERKEREHLLPLAETLRSSVHELAFKVEGEDRSLSVSIGLSLASKTTRNVDDWLTAAFAAARTAARLGGNRVEGILSTSAHGLSPERILQIRELLRNDTALRGLVVDYQPLIPLRGTEAGRYSMQLHLRDRRQALAGIARHEFLPIARDMKLQGSIDRQVIARALQALEEKHGPNRVGNLLVPVDFPSFDREQLVWLHAEVTRRKLGDQHLTLEFEASFLIESAHAGRLLERLHALGLKVGAVERSGRLAHVAELAKLPLDVLRLPAGVLQSSQPEIIGPMLQPWYRERRELILEEVSDLTAIAQFWSMGADYLQGDTLATAGPRLDFDFSEINLS